MTHPDQEFLASPPRVRPVSPPTYWRCEPGWSWHARPLPDYLLWCVLEGVGHVSLGGRRTQLGPGTGVVFEPGDEPVARFTAQAGTSPLRYLIQARIDRAHQLLTETNMPVS